MIEVISISHRFFSFISFTCMLQTLLCVGCLFFTIIWLNYLDVLSWQYTLYMSIVCFFFGRHCSGRGAFVYAFLWRMYADLHIFYFQTFCRICFNISSLNIVKSLFKSFYIRTYLWTSNIYFLFIYFLLTFFFIL